MWCTRYRKKNKNKIPDRCATNTSQIVAVLLNIHRAMAMLRSLAYEYFQLNGMAFVLFFFFISFSPALFFFLDVAPAFLFHSIRVYASVL